MNWTSREPVENMKCIIETNTGCTFTAHYIKGTWWNTEKGFPVEGVKRWIVYPGGEEPNDYIAPEVLLKYVARNLKEMESIAKQESEKVKELKKLNKSLVTEYNTLLLAHRELQHKSYQKESIAEAKLEKKRVENRELAEKLMKLREKSDSGNSERMEKLLKEVEQLREELKLVRKQARKGRTLHGNLRKLLEQSCMLEAVKENQTEDEIVA